MIIIKNTLLLMLFGIILFVFGCADKYDASVVLQTDAFNTNIQTAEIIRNDTLYVYSEDGYVTKTILVEENILKKSNHDDTKELNKYAELTDETFNSDIFPTEGYWFTSKLTDDSFTWEMIYDYTKINIKEALENDKILMLVEKLIDKDYKIPYEKFVDAYLDSGYYSKTK